MAGHLQEVPHHAVPLHDSSPTHALDFITSENAFNGNEPDVSRLRVFGCKAFVRENTHGKLDACSLAHIFLGFATASSTGPLAAPHYATSYSTKGGHILHHPRPRALSPTHWVTQCRTR